MAPLPSQNHITLRVASPRCSYPYMVTSWYYADLHLSIWLGAVRVWLFLRQGTAESPSSVGSRSGIYNSLKTSSKGFVDSALIAETLTNQRFSSKQKGRQPRIEIDVLLWRRVRDLNPRKVSAFTRFPVVRLRPLSQLSKPCGIATLILYDHPVGLSI